MKIKDRVIGFTHNRFRWCCFSSLYKGYNFVLLIWRCLGIKYGDGIILRTCYHRRFCDLSLFIEQRFEFIYEIIFIRFFLVIYCFKKSWKKEAYGFFHLRRYVDVLQLPFVDIAAALYVVCKYLFALLLDNPFLLYIFLCILGK